MQIVGCFLFHDGKFVILHRHTHKPNGDTWGLPAGKVEPGEDSGAAMLRELREETGYQGDMDELELLGDFQFGAGANMYTFCAYKIMLNTQHDISLEAAAHSEYRWVTPEECYALPNLIPDFHELLKRIHFIQ